MGLSPSGEDCIASTPKTSCSDGMRRSSLFETRRFWTLSPFPAAITGVFGPFEGNQASPVGEISPPLTLVVDDGDMIKDVSANSLQSRLERISSQHVGEDGWIVMVVCWVSPSPRSLKKATRGCANKPANIFNPSPALKTSRRQIAGHETSPKQLLPINLRSCLAAKTQLVVNVNANGRWEYQCGGMKRIGGLNTCSGLLGRLKRARTPCRLQTLAVCCVKLEMLVTA